MEKLKIETHEENGDMIYNIACGKSVVEVICGADSSLMVRGPKSLISKAIGGRGDEDLAQAWFQDKDINSNSEAVHNLLEIMKVMQEE